jgi:hypothetical protein
MVSKGRVHRQRDPAFLFQVPLKPTLLPHGRVDPGGSHPIMGGVTGGSQPGKGGLAHP